MAYSDINFKTKKAFKDAVKSGAKVSVFNPGFGGPVPSSGTVCVEGPHYPLPHRWYATVTLKDGYVSAVK